MATKTTTSVGLRERKKQKTRTAIREAARRLAAAHGWEAVTIERIAAEADVSPSTVVRYFPVREDIVLTAEDDDRLEALLRARPADEEPLESLRAVLVEAVGSALVAAPDDIRLRARLMAGAPAVRARLADTTAETGRRLARALADRTGRAPDDLEFRVFTAAVLGALREATLHWAEHGLAEDLTVLLHRAVDTLSAGPARPARS
ncbi:TetR family transcriptional regulator [Streptomyces filamentosus]|uniref:acyl-CoA-like ligand-binding transcription factor n=1 Tax=Streptomyces filamentosus TaxID=67294 RepID=UPI0012385F63|nr:TetR family transcriptional regulator [Streptomyces filamentosus]KAA6219405.1 TetR family transcriptional regulator [Streptomyces filamentosus]